MHTNTDENGNPKSADRPSNIVSLTEATVLTADATGKTFALNAAAGAAIDLPAIADIESGWNVKFYVALAFATTNWTVVAENNVIQGGALVNGAPVPAVNENTISFVATAEAVGDYVDLFFDGTNFIASGFGVAAGAITFTAP